MGKVYHKTCKVEPRETANMIEAALRGEDGTEGFTYERTVKFGGGIEIEIACYGKNIVNGKEVEPWVDVTMYDHGVEVQQIINGGGYFGVHRVTDKIGNTYSVHITRDFSKFTGGIFTNENGSLSAVYSKERIFSSDRIKHHAACSLGVDEDNLNCVDCFVRWRAGHDDNGRSCVGWFLESEDSPTSCPVWVFTVEQYR